MAASTCNGRRSNPPRPRNRTMETPRIADAARGLRHVFLRDLVLPASIGVHPHEHAAPQRVRINVDLGVEDDAGRALSRPRVGRDDLRRVVDYEGVADAV